MMTRVFPALVAIVVFTSLCVSSATAAAVSWSFAELAQDGSNVATDGAIHTSVAYGAGAAGVRVINGVDFNTLTPGAHDNPLFSFIDNRNAASVYYGVAGDNGIKDTTDDIVFNTSMTLGINGLTPGQNYRIQLISFDAEVEGEGFAKESRLQTIAATSLGDSGSLDFNQFFTPDGSSQQNFRAALITGTFTAMASEIDFTISARDGNDNAILNAFIVQQLSAAVPTPAALPAGLTVLGLIAARRRRP